MLCPPTSAFYTVKFVQSQGKVNSPHELDVYNRTKLFLNRSINSRL
jgi:hypothetical protein